MNPVALGLVLTSALCHASWNYLTKKSQIKLAFLWWCLFIATFLYFPMFLYFWPQATISPVGWACIITTSILHALYFWFLGLAYEAGDLSIVYPLARGFGPLLVPILAVGLIGEELFGLGVIGIALIILGITLLHLPHSSNQKIPLPFLGLGGRASRLAFSTGGTIAFYSLVDKVGVHNVHPAVYIYLMTVGIWMLLTPYILVKKRMVLRQEWTANWRSIFVVGFLICFTYLLVLFAMQLSKVSYVAALRESSILFSLIYGAVGLREEFGKQRILGAALIFLGVFAIGLSR
jgi:uncharacterized membrane protein